ncbi:hypothetical protein MHU86_19594 [Fragilaria crotonensis]|nr:hypothetical protein MHU86_19594 [Fragilaria crotonensis]
MCALVILLLVLLQVVVGSALICNNATVSSTANFAFKVDLLYGQNATCPGGEEVAIRDAINDALTNMSITKSGGPTAVLSGDICVDNEGHRNLVLINSFTWTGRATCRLCNPGRRLLSHEQLSAAEEAAHQASLDLRNLITTTFVNDPGSCLYQDWATVVVVTVTEITQTSEILASETRAFLPIECPEVG